MADKDLIVNLEDLKVVGDEVSSLKSAFDGVTEPYGNLINEAYLLKASGWNVDNGDYYGKIGDANAAFSQNSGRYPVDFEWKTGTQYTLSLSAKTGASGQTSNGMRISFIHTDDSRADMIFPRSDTSWTAKTLTSANGKTVARLVVTYSNGANDVWHIKNMMLVEGTTAAEYKEYEKTAVDTQTRDIFVTPQMYGAVGDGVADDTAAFQRTIDTGFHITIPFSKGQKYLITNSLNITTPYQQIIGDHGFSNIMSPNYFNGSIIFKKDDNSLNGPILFNIKNHDVKIVGVNAKWIPIDNPQTVRNAYGIFARVQVKNASEEIVADADATIENCHISTFGWAAYFYGRGLTFKNNLTSGCLHGFCLEWDNSYGTIANENDILEHRAFIITGNRFHVQRDYLIYLRHGYANGLIFTGNVMDMGRGRVVVSDNSDANPQSWTISENIFNVMAFNNIISISNGQMRHCRIENNLFNAAKGRWTGSNSNDIRPYAYIRIDESLGCIIAGNTFCGSKQSPIRIKNADKLTVIGNSNLRYLVDNGTGEAIDDYDDEEEPTDTDALIDVSGTITNSVINSNNSAPSENLICGTGSETPTISNSVIYGNLHGSGAAINGVTLTNVRTDEN